MASGLEGIKVLELAQVVAAPLGSRLLADFGADVVHIEHPPVGDGLGRFRQGSARPIGPITEDTGHNRWENVNRNKRSMTLDVSQENGQQILYRLLEKADVFITNMRPYEIERYHLDYDTLSKLNPRLIYAWVTGVGKKGPERNIGAYDHTVYGPRVGWLHRLATKGQIIKGTPEAFGDTVVAIVLAYGIMTALYIREKTGIGQEVDVSLLHTGIFHRGVELCRTLNNGEDLQILESDTRSAIVNFYQTKDGKYLRFSLQAQERWWPGFCRAIEREDLEHDPRFETTPDRDKNSVVLMSILEEVFLAKTMEEWKACLGGIMPWAPVQNAPEVCNDPQARINGVFAIFDHPSYGPIQVVTNPVTLSKTPAEIRMPAPMLGQHTEEILLEHGYTREDIAKFKEESIIA